MSVLINGMKMPKNCADCRFAVKKRDGADEKKCVALDWTPSWRALPRKGRITDCPLVELHAQHGRLIDAGVFEVVSYKGIPDGYKDTFDDGVLWMCEKIDDAPTIIPADPPVMYYPQVPGITPTIIEAEEVQDG